MGWRGTCKSRVKVNIFVGRMVWGQVLENNGDNIRALLSNYFVLGLIHKIKSPTHPAYNGLLNSNNSKTYWVPPYQASQVQRPSCPPCRQLPHLHCPLGEKKTDRAREGSRGGRRTRCGFKGLGLIPAGGKLSITHSHSYQKLAF